MPYSPIVERPPLGTLPLNYLLSQSWQLGSWLLGGNGEEPEIQEKITKLVKSIEGSIKNVEVYLNPTDFSAITNYNTKNKINLSFKVTSDQSLQRGDLKIKSNAIEINEFVTDKLNFSSPESIDSDLQKIKETEQNNKNQNSQI